MKILNILFQYKCGTEAAQWLLFQIRLSKPVQEIMAPKRVVPRMPTGQT